MTPPQQMELLSLPSVRGPVCFYLHTGNSLRLPFKREHVENESLEVSGTHPSLPSVSCLVQPGD